MRGICEIVFSGYIQQLSRLLLGAVNGCDVRRSFRALLRQVGRHLSLSFRRFAILDPVAPIQALFGSDPRATWVLHSAA